MAEFNVLSNRGNQIDWSEISNAFGGSVLDWDKKIKQKRAEDEQIYRETNQMLQDVESNKSQSLNELILAGADTGRNQTNKWLQELKSGKINRAEFQRRTMNLRDNWKSLSELTKNMDARIQESLARQQVGPNGELPTASQIEVEMQGYFGSMANLINKKLDIDNEGQVMLATIGEDGQPVQMQNIKYMNNPLNLNYGRVDVAGMVNAEIENWGKWSIGRISDQRNNPVYGKMKNQLIETLTASPRSASSVLVDYANDDYNVYFSEQDRQAKLAELRKYNQGASDAELEKKLILMKQDSNGDYQPVLTPAQMEEAKKVVDREIEMQVGRDVAPLPASAYGGGGNSGSGDKNEFNGQFYEDIYTAWNLSKTSPKESANRLNTLAKDGYEFKWVPGGLQVYKVNYVDKDVFTTRKGPDGKTEVVKSKGKGQELTPIGGPVNTLDAIQKYFYKDYNDFDRDKNAFRGGYVPVSKSTGNKEEPPKMTQAEFDAKWAKLKKGQKLVGPDGVTYTKG